jgi:GNAT superfamily N-acetyltransferase
MVLVRPFEERDAQPLADLMMEMIHFYGATIDPTLVVAEDVVRQSEIIDIIVAQGDDGLLGFATFTSLYPVAGLISFTYVQQIYVAAKARRMGVAQRLMAGMRGSPRPGAARGLSGRRGRRMQPLGRSMMGWERSAPIKCSMYLRVLPLISSRPAQIEGQGAGWPDVELLGV